MYTYTPGRHEAEWLMQSLGDWFDDGTLTDILFPVRGGKEATVYACRGGPSTGNALLAAKVYRPRKFRELSNDAIYREGRQLFDEQGHGRRARDTRMARAVRHGTRKGKQASHISWVMHELRALQVLHAAGVPVPAPLTANRNTILMDFVGDETGAAPALSNVRPDDALAARLFGQVVDDIETLLSCDLVHGDLSPYNLLLWRDTAWMIDLPQACSVVHNPNAGWLLRRDITRVCEARSLGRRSTDPGELADTLWDTVHGTETGVPDAPVALSAPFDIGERPW